MRKIVLSSKFRRDLKKIQRAADKAILPDLNEAIDLLANDSPLPQRLNDHRLRGNMKNFRECHIRPDILLVYLKPPEELYLSRLGNHAELFDK